MALEKLFLSNALEHIPGGFLIYRANGDEEIIYANKALVNMFDCKTYEEFIDYVGGSFKGLVSPEDLEVIEKEIEIQIKSGFDSFDHIYYHIRTKSGTVKYIEDFGHYVVDPKEGPLYYVYLVDSDQKMLTYDIDKVTGLPGGRRFRDYSHKMINIMSNSIYTSSYAFVYLNLSHFKRFTIRNGIKAGDDLLKDVASILKKAFSSNMVARLGDTIFSVFSESQNIEEKIKHLNKTLRNTYGYKDVLLKAGAYVIGNEDISNLDAALDNARKACHELDYSDEKLYKIYDDEMKKSQRIYNYVLNNIDKAINNGWIKAYYQPVIRTLSGTLCSAEALARWIDPEFGVLNPENIIEALEDARQIHKLDEYMLNEICKLIRDRINKGLGVIPISFNLSRLDFVLMDVYTTITNACNKYQIPHSALKIEITESIVIEDPEGVVEVVNMLRKEGFEIWMDDFGKGYSSLGTLKDFNFDEIKLDMSFMQDFSYKSQQIVKNTISMAKSLGIQTLAEGVESESHLEFLKTIGCEKAQGFLFSRPLPFDDMLALLSLRGITMEATRFSHFYDEISRIDFNKNEAMCIVNYNKNTKLFEFLFLNDSLKELLKYININNSEELNDLINSKDSVFGQKMRNPIYLTEKLGVETTFFYTYSSNYIKIQSKNIASLDEHLMYLVYIKNLTTEDDGLTTKKLESSLRHLYSMCDEVYHANIKDNTVELISNDSSESKRLEFNKMSYIEAIDYISKTTIYDEDIELFKNFLDRKTLIERIIKGSTGYIARPIRVYDKLREIHWKMIFAILISNKDESNILIVTRKLTNDEERGMLELTKIDCDYTGSICANDIFKSSILYSTVKFFWKDKNRRFVGASKAFLEAFNFKNLSEIEGKTDEEINWDITLKDPTSDDLDVLNNGKLITSLPTVRIIKGVPTNIAITKWPIYSNGKIVGIFGYFVNQDDISLNKDYEAGLIDVETNILNSRGFLDSLLKYINESRKLNVPFSAITIRVRNMKEIEMLQGSDVANNVEKAIAIKLKECFGKDSSISHIGFGDFSIIRSFLNESQSNDFKENIIQTIQSIKSVDGVNVTLFIDTVSVNSEEAKNSPSEFNKIFIDRFNEIALK